MQSVYSILILSLVFLAFPDSSRDEIEKLKYHVNSPEACNLTKDLTEISGLTFDTEKNCFYAINDEEGLIFSIHQESCESQILINFKKKGDFEGIELVDKHIYVLESKGNLHRYNIEKTEITVEYKTDLGEHNNSEGLGLDLKTNSLLIACKDDDSLDKKRSDKNVHAIYRFDLGTQELVIEPWMLIRDDALLAYYESTLTYFKWLRSKLAEDRLYSFAPSAVAINPIDDLVYVLSSRGKMLVAMTRDQQVEHIYYLDDGAYIQPEGITFDSQGNMYISNEGKGYHGNILKIVNKKG